jgi:serine/threonine-protein kinase
LDVTDRPQVWLQKAESPVSATSATLPSVLARPALRRLQIVSMTMALGVVVLSFLMPLASGELASEVESLDGWLPDVFNVVISLSVFALARSERASTTAMINVGLVYQVLAGFFVSFTTYGRFARGIAAWDDPHSFLGPGWVAVWMMLFAILLPARPVKALFASLATAATVPLTVGVASWMTGTALVPKLAFFRAWVLPYLIVTATAFFANLVLYRLGRDVQRAHEHGSYLLEDRIGSGGMGEVWRARHRMLARPAAIKLITESLGDEGASDAALTRFAREAEATAELQSPHTVGLYDFGVCADGHLYYAMELLDGVDLETFVERFGPMSQQRVVHVLIQACASLSEAHRHGLVHGDIKPANIFLTRFALENDFVKVLDFGLVKRKSELSGEAAGLSRADQISGTPAYLAPELALGEEADGRADLYALGCVAYWLLTGERMFAAASELKMVVADVMSEPTPPSKRMSASLLPELEEIVMSCLSKDPKMRPSSATELAASLAQLALPERWSSQRADAWWDRHRQGSDANRTSGLTSHRSFPTIPSRRSA